MGSDVYAYFTVTGEGARSADLDDLAKDTGNDLHGSGTSMTARLDAASDVRRGRDARLWYDTAKLHLFDPSSGKNLLATD
jgi:multiple sugar transport system ATP-binding protein